MNIKWIFALALAAFIGIQAFRFNALERKKADLESSNLELGRQLTGSADALKNSQQQVRSLSATVSGLVATTATQASALSDAERQKAETKAQLVQTQLDQRNANDLLFKRSKTYTPLQIDSAANIDVGEGLGLVASPQDAVRQLGLAKAGIHERDNITIPTKDRQIRQQTDRAETAEKLLDSEHGKRVSVENQISGLEIELNHSYNAAANTVETANKGGFIGRGKRVRRAINEVRAGRVN